MIRRIRLKNYMSHTDTVLELADGLNVLVGPNNCGKSAVVEALATVAYNASGDYMIRHGESECSIEIETDDGHTICWRRRKKVVSYTIDGQDYHRLGRGGTPDRLHEVLRLPRVETSGDPFDIHFGRQKSPIFLLDEPGSRAALFFASSSDAATLLEMQRLHKKKCVRARDDIKRLDGELQQLDARLEQLAPCDQLADQVTALEKAFDAIERGDRRNASLRQLLADKQAARQMAQQRTAELAALEPLAPPPKQHDPRPLAGLIEQWRTHAARQQASAARQAAIAPLVEPPALVPEDTLRQAIGLLRSTEQQVTRLELRTSALTALAQPPELHDRAPLAACLEQLREALAGVELRQTRVARLKTLKEPPKLDDPSPLAAHIDAWRTQHVRVDTLAAQCETLESRRADLEQEIRLWARDTETCPTCGGELDEEQLLARTDMAQPAPNPAVSHDV